MRTALALGSLASGGSESLCSVGISGLGAYRCGSGFITDEHLCFELLVEVFNFLCASQQTGLLGIGRVKTHAVLCYSMAAFDVNHFTGLQLVARSQRIVKLVCGVAAMQPVAQHSRQASVVQAQQIGQRFEADRWVRARGRAATGGRIKPQLGGWRVPAIGTCKAAHHVELAHGQGA